MFSAALGGAAFTDFQRASARAIGDAADSPSFRRRVSAGSTLTAGAAVTYWVTDGAGLRGGFSYSPTRFSVHNDDEADVVLGPGEWERDAYARLDVWQASGALVFRFPVMLGRLVPWGMAGGGIVHYRATEDMELPPEARRRFERGSRSAPAAVLGIGATVPLQRRNLLMNFELTSHITPTPLDDEGSGEFFEMAGVPLRLDRYAGRDSDGIGMTSHYRLTVGLTLPIQ
jgi:hypothetical protein